MGTAIFRKQACLQRSRFCEAQLRLINRGRKPSVDATLEADARAREDEAGRGCWKNIAHAIGVAEDRKGLRAKDREARKVGRGQAASGKGDVELDCNIEGCVCIMLWYRTRREAGAMRSKGYARISEGELARRRWILRQLSQG
jgi:hypothetical protein